MRSLSIIAVSLLAAACSQQPAPVPAAAAAGSPPAAPVAAAPASTPAPTPQISGEQAFATCVACHSRDAGAPQRMGPNLRGVVGRKAGSNPGFDYSPALKASNITWDAAQLDAYLAAPAKHVPGTRMVIAVPDPARRQALIEYLSAP
ncbi:MULTISPECIES: c-type cytochrome [unclassified Stenotrophomonas]|uniref:c-type cytochrome n=1 Tax=unclassified Stenotrophomonas TaxID=196198 RepID=UPI0025F04A9A|nr:MULTISPECIES: c-type cytochrome [unclassified Stenotrophomonas]